MSQTSPTLPYGVTMTDSTRRLYRVEWTQYSIRPKRSTICNRCFPGPTRVLDANGISIASAVFARLTRWLTDWQTTLLGR